MRGVAGVGKGVGKKGPVGGKNPVDASLAGELEGHACEPGIRLDGVIWAIFRREERE